MHRIKKKFTIQKAILAFSIVFITTFYLMSAANHTIAFANGNGDDITHPGDLDEHTGEGYPASAKTGWLAYLYKYEEGSTPFGAALIPTGNLTGNMPITSVFGVAPSRIAAFNIDAPWTTNFVPNGNKVKNGLISEDSPYYWAKLVEFCWGKSVLDVVNEEPEKYYLVLEVVDCHAITPGPGGGSGVTTATVHNWAQIDMANGKPSKGDGKTGWCDNAVAPDSAFLDKDWEGLPAPPTIHATSKFGDGGRLDSALVGDPGLGYGMVAVRLKNDMIHTYWAPNGSPGFEEPADPPKDGHYNMVKYYYTKYMKNGVLEKEEVDAASPYTVENCIPTISVDDEPNEWHLEHWSTNTFHNPGIGYQAVRSMKGPQYGDGAKVIKLCMKP